MRSHLRTSLPLGLMGLLLPLAARASNCPNSLSDLVSSAEVTLVEGPVSCGSPDAAVHLCGVFKARIETPVATSGPIDDPTLDDAAQPTNILLVVRTPSEAALCSSRWIALDAGGHGNGYGPAFGKVPPGHYVPGGAGYGDDLIRSYNDAGYVTLDIIFECRDKPGEPCNGTPFAGWAPEYPLGSGWFHILGGTGYVGAGSRARAVYEWALLNNGGNRICAHGQSSGTGKLMAVLTRYGGEHLFDTVVHDGGPVMTYTPWYCGGMSEGPLGPMPDEFPVDSCNRDPVTGQCTQLFPENYDCARTPGNNENQCSYRNCRDGVYDEFSFLADSHFYRASTQAFPTLDLGVVLGGQDNSPARHHSRLWLAGYAYGDVSIPGLSARSITLKQGYCTDTATTWAQDRSCDEWNLSRFPGIGGPGRGYDARLVGVGHDTARSQNGMNVIREVMLATCEATPAPAGWVPDGGSVPGVPLTVNLESGGDLTLSWSASCATGDNDYAIYEGTIGVYYSHVSKFCSTGGATTKTFTPVSGSSYYLVVPRNALREGSYGIRSDGSERPQGTSPCLPQEITQTCP